MLTPLLKKVIKSESCPHCRARLERGDDGTCNRCGKPWPLAATKQAVAAARAAVKAVTGHTLPEKTVTLQQLLHAKRESDRRNYAGKHAILQKLLTERPGEFIVDSHAGPMVGLTHVPSRFKIHAPRALAAGLIRPPTAPLLTEAALSRGGQLSKESNDA